ncbi:hypothetical protein [Candidatus Burkholderia verschuerenii]|nr:hypothetical protein [Candidatus Burkholderia verschuerenii]
MNSAIALVAGLMLFEPFTRPPVSRFTTHRMRRSLAKRSYCQASAAFLAAMMVVTYQPPPERISPLIVLGVAALLMTAGIYWVVRGKRLARQRRVFNDLG